MKMSSTYYAEKEVEFIHQDSEGNDVRVTGTVKDSYEVHYVASLNGRVSIMKIAEVQAEVCKSSKDVTIFWKLIDMLNPENELHINITDTAKKWGLDRSNLAKFLARMLKSELLIKHKAGHYMCNPYIIGAKQASKKILEQLQMDWKILKIDSLPKDEQLLMMMEYAELDFDVRLLPAKGKSYDFIQGLLEGFKEHGKLTSKQLDSLVSTVIRHRQLLAESKFRKMVTTKYNLLKPEEMTEEQKNTFNAKKKPRDKLEYWQSISPIA